MSESAIVPQDEIDRICDPLRMPAAQVRYLRNTLRMHVERKPNGKPLLLRSELERAHGAARLGQVPVIESATTGPNVVGLTTWANKRKSRGQKTQGR